MIDSFFTEDELNPGIDAINDLVDELARKLYNGGKIKSRPVLLFSDVISRVNKNHDFLKIKA